MKRALHWTSIALLCLCALGVVYELRALGQADAHNAAIAALVAGRDVPLERLARAPDPVRLARAVHLHRKKRYDEALATLNLILDRGDPAFRAKVFYNLGNLHLTQAMESVERSEFEQAVPLIELAKAAYRDALLTDSAYWDAKYNLEVAMRLLPEMARIDAAGAEDKEAEDALWTSVPDFPRGLP